MKTCHTARDQLLIKLSYLLLDLLLSSLSLQSQILMLEVCHFMAQQIPHDAHIMHNLLFDVVPETFKICSRKLASSISSCCSIASEQCALA